MLQKNAGGMLQKRRGMVQENGKGRAGAYMGSGGVAAPAY